MTQIIKHYPMHSSRNPSLHPPKGGNRTAQRFFVLLIHPWLCLHSHLPPRRHVTLSHPGCGCGDTATGSNWAPCLLSVLSG